MRALLVALALLAAAVPARADLVLGPGEPFGAAAAERLLRPLAGTEFGLEVLTPALPLNNRSTKPVHLAVMGFGLDAANGAFWAEVAVIVTDGPTNSMRLTGRASPMIELPVLSETAGAGTILAEAQFRTVWLPASSVPADALLDAGVLVGSETTRRLAAGRPLRVSDVREPLLVRRGDTVAVVLETGQLALSALGRALEDGVRDAPVRVLNLDSRRELRTVVVDRRRVAVLHGGGAR